MCKYCVRVEKFVRKMMLREPKIKQFLRDTPVIVIIDDPLMKCISSTLKYHIAN